MNTTKSFLWLNIFILMSISFSAVARPQSQEKLPYQFKLAITSDQSVAVAEKLLETNLLRAAQPVGIGLSTSDGVFLFESEASITTINTEVVRTPQTGVTVELLVTLSSSQSISAVNFGEESFVVKGFGASVNAARTQALRNGTVQGISRQYFENVNHQVTQYFNNACESILRNSQVLARDGNYQATIHALSMVPPGASECWTKAQKELDAVILEASEAQCSARLLRARSLWAASKSRNNAMEVAEELSSFYPGLPCDSDVNALLSDIESTIIKYDKEAAERLSEQRLFKQKQYEDALLDRRNAAASSFELASSEIEAFKEVGIEMAKSWAKADASWISVFR